MDMTERVEDLIFVCERMIPILIKENDALKKNNASAIAGSLDEKDKLSRFYERHTRAISNDIEGFKAVNLDLRETLKELSQELDKLIQINAKTLKMNMDIARRVLVKFADVAKKITPHSGTYSNDAHVGPRGESATPISLNETL